MHVKGGPNVHTVLLNPFKNDSTAYDMHFVKTEAKANTGVVHIKTPFLNCVLEVTTKNNHLYQHLSMLILVSWYRRDVFVGT